MLKGWREHNHAMLTDAHGLTDETKGAPEDRVAHESIVKGFVDLFFWQKHQRYFTWGKIVVCIVKRQNNEEGSNSHLFCEKDQRYLR